MTNVTEETAVTARPEASEIWMGALPDVETGGLERPRIGIAGISIESSTFSPHISGDEAFTVRTGAELRAYYPFLDEGRELAEAADWVPLTHGRSLPGGAVDADTYRRMKTAIVDGIRAHGPFDGFFFDIHGAMSVVGMDDAEGISRSLCGRRSGTTRWCRRRWICTATSRRRCATPWTCSPATAWHRTRTG